MRTIRFHAGYVRSASVAALIALGSIAWVGPTAAQSTIDAAAACSQDADPGRAISGCTSLLEGGALNAEMQASVLNMRGVAHQNAGDLGRALRDYAEATKRDPKQLGAIAGLALVIEDLNRRCFRETAAPAVIEGCTLLIENAAAAEITQATLARAHMARASVLVKQGKSREARADYASALERKGSLDAALVKEAETALADQTAPVPREEVAQSPPTAEATAPRAVLAVPVSPEAAREAASQPTAQAPSGPAAVALATAPRHPPVLQTAAATGKPARLASRGVRLASARPRSVCR